MRVIVTFGEKPSQNHTRGDIHMYIHLYKCVCKADLSLAQRGGVADGHGVPEVVVGDHERVQHLFVCGSWCVYVLYTYVYITCVR